MFKKFAISTICLCHGFPNDCFNLILVHRREVIGGKHVFIKHVCVLSKDLDLVCKRVVYNHNRKAAGWAYQTLHDAQLFDDLLLFFYVQNSFHVIKHYVKEYLEPLKLWILLSVVIFHHIQIILQCLDTLEQSRKCLLSFEVEFSFEHRWKLQMLGLILQYTSKMLRSMDRNEFLRVKLNAVDVNERTSVSLWLEHVGHKCCFSASIWTVHENVSFWFNQGQEDLHVVELELPLFIFEIIDEVSFLIDLSLFDLLTNLSFFNHGVWFLNNSSFRCRHDFLGCWRHLHLMQNIHIFKYFFAVF